MIIFDIITGQLKYVNPIAGGSGDGVIDFSTRSLGDITLDMGYRLQDNAIIDFQSRV